jgi:hypothetical protein
MEVRVGGGAPRRGPRFGWVLAAVASVALAAITAFAGGFGARLADLVASPDPPLLSYSVSQLSGECNGGTFLPRGSMGEILRAGPPSDWSEIEAQPGSAAAGRDPIEVSIQGESTRTVTLTGIAFDVTRRPRPGGATFGGPCGGPVVGRALEVDLDSTPARVVESSAEPNGMLGSQTVDGRPLVRPIRFPWTVSVTDPLLLYVIATTKSCYCTWSAEIPWVSGGKRGTIRIDDAGSGFQVADTEGLAGYSAFEEKWNRYPPSL